MIYRESPPSQPLRAVVAAYWGINGHAGDGAASRRILPDGGADLICDFSVSPPRLRWVGTMTRAIHIYTAGPQDVFGIRFAPGGLFPLLGAPLSLLTDDSVELSLLLAKAWRPPLDGWQRDSCFTDRCARADISLRSILPTLGQATPMQRLLRRLSVEPEPPISAAALAADAGMGLRTLQRRFMDHLGVSPKQHLRYLRFERARHLMMRPGSRQVDVALVAGYADQAHFSREFRRFAGATPGSGGH